MSDPGTIFYLWGVALVIAGAVFAAEWRSGPLGARTRFAGGALVGIWTVVFALTPGAGGEAPLVPLFVSTGFLLLFAIMSILLMRREGVGGGIGSRGGGGGGALMLRLAIVNPGRRPWRRVCPGPPRTTPPPRGSGPSRARASPSHPW